MTCNDDLHDSLVDIGEISCPFCYKKLEDYDDDEKPQDRSVKHITHAVIVKIFSTTTVCWFV